MEAMIRAVLVSAVLLSVPAVAQTPASLDEARTRFKRGTELYDEGNYRGALVEFQRAFEAAPNFKLLYNIALVHLALQDYARAVQSFTRYLTEGGNEVNPARREEVTHEIERLKPRIGQLVIETARGAEVLIDDESVGFAPLPGPLPANTGRHKVAVIVEGRETSRSIDIAGQQTLTVVLAAEAPSAAPPAAVATAPAPSGVRASVIVCWGLTAALAISAAAVAGLANASADELGRMKSSFGVTKLQLDTQAQKTLNTSIAADVLTGAAVVAGIVSLVVTFSGGSSSPAPVALTVGPSGLGIAGAF